MSYYVTPCPQRHSRVSSEDGYFRIHQQVCRSSLLSGRNIRWPRRMLPSGESRSVCRWDRRTDGLQTVTLRFPLDAASVINQAYQRRDIVSAWL